jgi:hypothetical protein
MVPYRYEGFFNPFPVIFQSSEGYFLGDWEKDKKGIIRSIGRILFIKSRTDISI